MNPAEFVIRQGELRSKLRWAVPRSQRARDLERKLRDLLREELEQETASTRRVQISRIPESQNSAPHAGDRTRWWDR